MRFGTAPAGQDTVTFISPLSGKKFNNSERTCLLSVFETRTCRNPEWLLSLLHSYVSLESDQLGFVILRGDTQFRLKAMRVIFFATSS